MQIGDRVKAVREYFGLSQADLAKKISVERSTVSLIERKQRNATERTIRDICRELNVSRYWLETGEGEMLEGPSESQDALIAKVLAGEDQNIVKAFQSFARFSSEDWEALAKVIDALQKK